ncbi:hypothetical protein [Arthrobacter sp. S2(2024)]
MAAVEGEEVDVVREAFGDAVFNEGLAAGEEEAVGGQGFEGDPAATR